MPVNLLKEYPQLLELAFLDEEGRKRSLMGVFKRDIEDNEYFSFRRKRIWPVKGEEPGMQLLFKHLTTCEIETEQEEGKVFKRREFEMERSLRIHWIRPHIEEALLSEKIDVFSVEERAKGKNVIRTYILNQNQRYVIILEPYRSVDDYYFITAYRLQPRNYKKMKNKMKRKLKEVA